MEQIRLIMLVESRIRGNVYVRFGGEFLKTSHSNMERRWELSLHPICHPEKLVVSVFRVRQDPRLYFWGKGGRVMF